MALVLVSLSFASCLTASWEQRRSGRPLDEILLAELPENGLSLAQCLETLGAPEFVWEHRIHGIALAYAWYTERDLGGTVSVPVDSESVSFSYSDIRTKQHAVVFYFDENWVLEDRRRGFLNELMAPKRRPASLDDIELELGEG